MKTWEKLEGKINKGDHSKSKHLVQLSLVLVLAGVTLVFGGINTLRGKSIISADVAVPPVPPEPAANINPPVPATPDGNFTFAAGWSLVSGESLAQRSLTGLKDAGLILYSFNDPAYPTRVWSTYPDSSGAATSINAQAPYGYYIYNPGTADVKVTLNSLTTTQAASTQEMAARGWHLMYWQGDATSYSDLMSKINLKYSDGTQMSATDATNTTNHRASIKLYLVNNGTSTDAATAIKELASSDSNTTVSNIPAKSYFWIYLRRTKDRVTQMSIVGQASSSQTATPSVTATPTDSSIANPPIPNTPTPTATTTPTN